LRPHPVDGNIPAPAKVCHLDFKDSYASAPGMDPGLGGVFDQDTDNLAAQTRGFKGSMRTAETLGNYQEIRTRHLHETIDKYMARP
jgi:hypothetical protein